MGLKGVTAMKRNSIIVEKSMLDKTLADMNRINREKGLGYKIRVSRFKDNDTLCKISVSL